jgi:hypothetical protein
MNLRDVLATLLEMSEIAGKDDGLLWLAGKGQCPLDDGEKQLPLLPGAAGKEAILRAPVPLIPPRCRQSPGNGSRSQSAEHPKGLTAEADKDPFLGKDKPKIIKQKKELFKKQGVPPLLVWMGAGKTCWAPCAQNDPCE